MTAADDTATHNSSEAGGTLPKNMRFARINYGTETVLPTRLWLWKYVNSRCVLFKKLIRVSKKGPGDGHRDQQPPRPPLLQDRTDCAVPQAHVRAVGERGALEVHAGLEWEFCAWRQSVRLRWESSRDPQLIRRALRSAWMLEPISNAWATYHKYMSKIPSFVLLMVSGMMMNFVVGFVRSLCRSSGTSLR